MVEQGYRVAFFAPVERRARAPGRHPARILGAVPTGSRAQRSRVAVSRGARLSRRPCRQHLSDQRTGPPRRDFPGFVDRLHRLRGPVRSVGPDGAVPASPRASSAPSPPILPISSPATTWSTPRTASGGSGTARNRAGRAKGRLHAARIRRRSQALRSADAHGPGREVSRRRRSRTAPRPPGRRHLDRSARPASKPKCATWRTSC